MTIRRAARSPSTLLIAGLPAPLELRESARTRRLTLRVDAGRGLIQVVVPPGLPEAEVRRFVSLIGARVVALTVRETRSRW